MDTVDISSDSEVTASFYNVFFGGDQINTHFSKQMIKGWNNKKPEKTPYINIFGFPPNSILSRQVVHQGQNDTRAQNLLQAVSRNCKGILSETFLFNLVV